MSRNSQKKSSIVFFLIPQFTMLPFAAAVETLRIANRMLGYQAYEWRIASLDGQKVMSSSGMRSRPTGSTRFKSRSTAAAT